MAVLCVGLAQLRRVVPPPAGAGRGAVVGRSHPPMNLKALSAVGCGSAVGTCLAVAAVVAVIARRRRRADTLRQHGATRLFLVRHAERQDHKFPQWAATAARPHDAPLSDEGFEQARRTGRELRRRVKATGGVDYVRTSPLVRCVQTAACLTASVGVPALPLQVDEALCEEEAYLRPRMMGTHRLSVPAAERTAVPRTCDDAPRGVCQPVLLRPSDLLSIHRQVDLSYRGQACPVEHDPATGVELDASTHQPQCAEERARRVVAALSQLAPPGSTTVLVTHGRFARRLGELLLGHTCGNFAYSELAELVCVDGEDCGAGKWSAVGERWSPSGDAGRSSMA